MTSSCLRRVVPVCLAVLPALFLVSCSTVTPYTSAIAKESEHYGKLTKGDAVSFIWNKSNPASGQADYGSYAVDEEGFSFKRTTTSESTEYKDGKPVTTTHTEWATRNVPWDAVTRTSSYLRDYSHVFTDEYRITLTYNVTELIGNRRARTTEDFDLVCRNYTDLVDVLAALQALTGE